MKYILTTLLALLSGIASAQPINYEIKGKIKHFTPGERLYFTHSGHIDSTIINNGKFSFKGSTQISNEPEENYFQSIAKLILRHDTADIDINYIYDDKYIYRDVLIIYLEPGITEVAAIDTIHTATIIPPRVNSGHYTLDSIYNTFYRKLNSAYHKSKNRFTDIRYIDSLNNVSMAEQNKELWQFVKDHPASPVSLYILKHDEDSYPTYDRLAPYFEHLVPALKQTEFGKSYAAIIDGLKSTRIEAFAPDFAMSSPDGNNITLSSFKGKYVLVDFWASWCSPCRQENPTVVKAYAQFKNQNFDILGVSLDEKKDDWVKAVEEDHLTWTQVSDLKGWDNIAGKLYRVRAVPQNFLIDPTGKIIAHNLFGDELTNKLKQIFGPIANLK